MAIKLNPNKQWRQSNSNEALGNIRAIWGCDLEYGEGKIRIAPGFVSDVGGVTGAVINSTNETLFTCYPAAMVTTNASTIGGSYARYIISQAQRIYVAGNDLDFQPDGNANSPTDPRYDMTVFSSTNSVDNLFVATQTNIFRLNNGLWIANFWTSSTALAQSALGSNPHPLTTFLSPYGSFMFVADGTDLHSIDTTFNSSV